jgi:HTH-type transcriptional regulator/antitoxin HipB
MSTHFAIRTAEQLSAYLRALRKSRGLTQRQLAEQLGVSIARVSVIEQNPGAVSLKQLLRLLHALGANLSLDSAPAASEAAQPDVRRPRGEW